MRALPHVVLGAILLFAVPRALALSFACPPGTWLHEKASESWCATPNGVESGPLWGRYPDGRLRYYATARAGRTEGTWRSWHSNGARAIEAGYLHGELTGPFREWDASGHLLRAGRHDRSGEMDGVWTRFWPSGRVRTRWSMKHGHQSGPVTVWYENGVKKLEGRRANDLPDGRWTTWNDRGVVTHECRYEAGRLVAGDCADPVSD